MKIEDSSSDKKKLLPAIRQLCQTIFNQTTWETVTEIYHKRLIDQLCLQLSNLEHVSARPFSSPSNKPPKRRSFSYTLLKTLYLSFCNALSVITKTSYTEEEVVIANNSRNAALHEPDRGTGPVEYQRLLETYFIHIHPEHIYRRHPSVLDPDSVEQR